MDTNIIIYAAQPQYPHLLDLVEDPASAVSLISYVESLGFPHIAPDERNVLEGFFAAMDVLPVTDLVAREAVRLRQQRKMSSATV